MNEQTDHLQMSTDEYKQWWLDQFPCNCDHAPEDHFLAPIDGKCRSCFKCHGSFGGAVRCGQALVRTTIDAENQTA